MATRPPPPEPYVTWLDYMLNPHRNGYETCVGRAAAEPAELRAEPAKSRQDFKELLELNNELIIKVIGPKPPDPADEYLRTARKA